MTDEIKKHQGQNPGQSGPQNVQQQSQQKHDDPSKKNPAQDHNQEQHDRPKQQEQNDKQKQQDQGGQPRAS
jgi:hypothetical protein